MVAIRPYVPEVDDRIWDEIVSESLQGNFLHSRRFLAYHGNRFQDQSFVIERDSGFPIGIFPAATNPANPHEVVSHPGATYGGVVVREELPPQDWTQLLDLFRLQYRKKGYQTLVYKAVPGFLHRTTSEIDQYFLWKSGATTFRRDLWNVARLGPTRRLLAKKKRAEINKARRFGLDVRSASNLGDYATFHGILADNLRERHRVEPVHSMEELQQISQRLGEKVALLVAESTTQKILAGALVFKLSPNVWHTQYIASTAEGRKAGAIDLTIERLIQLAESDGVTRLSFGSSTEKDGSYLNEGLFAFKHAFGEGTEVQDFYRLQILGRDGNPESAETNRSYPKSTSKSRQRRQVGGEPRQGQPAADGVPTGG